MRGCRGGSRPAGGSVTPAREMCCTEGHATPTETPKNSLIVKGSDLGFPKYGFGKKIHTFTGTKEDIRGKIIVSLHSVILSWNTVLIADFQVT